MNAQKTSLTDNIFGWVVGVPIVLALLIIFSPVLLYFFVVRAPIDTFQKNAFLKRNADKKILCVSRGRKFQTLLSRYRDEILGLGVDEIVLFDASSPNNRYDGFEWNSMISRVSGFPVLVTINGKALSQESLKVEFMSYFKKEIDWVELKRCIKRKVDGKNY